MNKFRSKMFLKKLPSSFPLPKWLYEPLLFLLSVIVLIGAAEQSKKDLEKWQPVPLTAPHELPKEIFFNSQDQCMPHPGREDIKSYGLMFARRFGGSCPKGLLVCYESQLNPRSTQTGLVTDPRHGVINLNGNLVARLCRTFRQKYIRKNGKKKTFEVPQWHGLLVNTTGKDEDGGFGIQLSYTNRTFAVKAEQQFKLLFGNKDDLRTNISILDEYGLYSEPKMLDEALANAYFRDAQRGAKLKRYAGLWSLGVDMLPHESRHSFNVKVFERSDNEEQCMLDAWFISPTDENEPEIETTTTSTTTTTTPPRQVQSYTMFANNGLNTTDFGVRLNSPTDSSVNFSITVRIDNGVIIVSSNNNGEERTDKYSCLASSEANSQECSDERLEKIRFRNPEDGELMAPKLLANATVTVAVSVHRHYVVVDRIEIQLPANSGGVSTYKFTGYHWPAGWWNELPVADNLVAEPLGDSTVDPVTANPKPEGDAIKDLAKRLNKKSFMSHVFAQEFTTGSTITLRGFFKENAKKFDIILLHNVPREYEDKKNKTFFVFGDIVMKMEMFLAKEGGTVFSNRVNGIVNESLLHGNINGNLVKYAPFECQLKAIEDAEGNPKFKVDFYQNGAAINFPEIESPLPHWAVNYFNIIDGGAILRLGEPVVDFGPISPNRMLIKPLPLHDAIEIIFEPAVGEKETNIYFLHGVYDYNEKIGDIPLHIQILYKKENNITIIMNSYNRKRGDNALGNNAMWSDDFDADQMTTHSLTISAFDYSFSVEIQSNGKKRQLDTYRYGLGGMQPWLIDHISMAGKLSKREIVYNPKSQKIGSLPYSKPFDYKESSKKLPKIKFTFTIVPGNIFFSVNFVNGGLYTHKYNVQTIFSLEFYNDHLVIGDYIGGKKRIQSNHTYRELSDEAELQLEITVLKNAYKLKFDKWFKQTLQITGFLPPWLIQHISVEPKVELVKFEIL